MAIDHLAAIQSGSITKGNIIGIRKALNAQWRRDRGYDVSCTAPAPIDVDELMDAIRVHRPRVTGELHASGLKLLRSPRYAKRWSTEERAVIDRLDHFELVWFNEYGRGRSVPVYRAVSASGGHFDFYNIPWQSGGNGPQID